MSVKVICSGTEFDLNSSSDLKKLDVKLKTSKFLGGESPTVSDRMFHKHLQKNAVKLLSDLTLINLMAYAEFIASFSMKSAGNWKNEDSGASKKDVDEIDLFGDDDDDTPVVKKQAPKKEDKPAKKEKVERTFVVIDIKP